MKAYKGFNKDLKCRDFQFELGGEYETKRAKLCEEGFHACENPLDVLGYYGPVDNRFCEVELEEVSDERHMDDSKVVGKRIKIGAEIKLGGLIDAGVKFILDRVDFKNAKESNTGFQSAATNTGNRSAATNTGFQSAATNTGDRSAATNTGDYSAATNTGDYSAATNTGDRSAATNTGFQSAATNTGFQSAATVEGRDSVAIATGYESKAKASLGSAIVVVERGKWNGETYPIINIKAAIVDGKKIKADTFYTLKKGKFVEVKE